ncbi:hypothetical protein CCACVL1_20329 [Corchorus capsularis]|uniref:CCHC-type domain-containing protein n=1 Tax=Corchorus capsularis TaxID=210143 RepID=A0A1R3HBR0_COCAP|nr:hypothetical protein CCACVL1_20329 [Corchorus capsularis]
MPATAGRVRMPANNRVHSSAALQTHGIWQSAIGYDPYAPNKDDSKTTSNQMAATAEPDGENAYASFQGLLALARITGSNADEARGACRKCGRVGHLTFQCKNFVSLKESKEKEPELQAAVLNGLDKLKGGKVNGNKEVESESEEEEEESESSDSDVDSEMERIIAERYGRKDDEYRRHRKRKSRKEKRRRRSHRSSDDSESSDVSDDSGKRHRRKSQRNESRSDSDVNGSEDYRVGRGAKRSEERSRKRRHEYDE